MPVPACRTESPRSKDDTGTDQIGKPNTRRITEREGLALVAHCTHRRSVEEFVHTGIFVEKLRDRGVSPYLGKRKRGERKQTGLTIMPLLLVRLTFVVDRLWAA